MGGKELFRGILSGAAAGAAGTTALTVASGIDAVVRGRPASNAPARLVAELLDRAGVSVPGGRGERGNRVDALGPLAAAAGVTLGALAGGLRTRGLRLPTPLGGMVLGAAAMAASAAIPPPRAARASTLLRAAALGMATGARSTLGVAALACTSRPTDNGRIAAWLGSRTGTVSALLASAGELVADKLPATPGRSHPQVLAPRVALGAAAAAGMAGRRGDSLDLPVLVAVGTAVAAALLGERLRARMAHRFGSDLPGAIIEDAVAALLGFIGARR